MIHNQDGTDVHGRRLAGTDLDQLARYVLSLPYDVEVETPDQLRARVRDLAGAVIQRHHPAQT